MRHYLLFALLALIADLAWSQSLAPDKQALVDKYVSLSPSSMRYVAFEGTVFVYDSSLKVDLLQKSDGSHPFDVEKPIARVVGSGGKPNLDLYFSYGPLPPFSDIYLTIEGRSDPTVYGKVICASASGTIYTERNVYSWAPVYYTEKYLIGSSALVKVEQPFYYIGRDSTANADLDIFFDLTAKSQIGSIAKGSRIEVVGYKPQSSNIWLLLKGTTGIIGWHKAFLVSDDPRKRDQKMLTVFSVELLTGNYP